MAIWKSMLIFHQISAMVLWQLENEISLLKKLLGACWWLQELHWYNGKTNLWCVAAVITLLSIYFSQYWNSRVRRPFWCLCGFLITFQNNEKDDFDTMFCCHAILWALQLGKDLAQHLLSLHNVVMEKEKRIHHRHHWTLFWLGSSIELRDLGAWWGSFKTPPLIQGMRPTRKTRPNGSRH